MGALFTQDTTKIVPGTISTWHVRSGSASADGYVDLGTLADAEIVLESLNPTPALRNGFPYGHRFTAKAKMLGTNQTACLPKLNLLTQYFNTHEITMISGQTVGGSSMGTRWRFVCEGGHEAYRYVEITADITLSNATNGNIDYNNLWDPSVQTAATSADPLYGFAPGLCYTAGVTQISLTSGSNTTNLSNDFRNPSIIADPIVVTNAKGAALQIGVDLKVAWDMMQTDETGVLDVFDTLNTTGSLSSLVVELDDGMYITMATPGLRHTYNAKGNFDDIAFIRVECQKAYTPAQFVALLS